MLLSSAAGVIIGVIVGVIAVLLLLALLLVCCRRGPNRKQATTVRVAFVQPVCCDSRLAHAVDGVIDPHSGPRKPRRSMRRSSRTRSPAEKSPAVASSHGQWRSGSQVKPTKWPAQGAPGSARFNEAHVSMRYQDVGDA
eukprot:scaffold7_cov378-Prasinococcus_capsulatus_cf.AAC.11